MKKMTIALFTAAAMGTSAFAVADEHGPTISGDIRFIYSDTSEELSNNRTKIAISGTESAMFGNEAFYYTRLSAQETSSDGVHRDYGFIGLRGDFGQLLVGDNDDLVYQFVGATTDVFRGQLPGGTAAGNVTYSANASDFFGADKTDPAVQYTYGAGDLTVAAHADTSESDNINTTQLAASYDLPFGSVSGAYSTNDVDDTEDEMFAAVTFGVAGVDVAAHIGENQSEFNPYSIAVTGDLTSNVSYQLGYADDDNGIADTIAQVIVDLGGGFTTFGNIRNGDSENGFVVGAQKNF